MNGLLIRLAVTVAILSYPGYLLLLFMGLDLLATILGVVFVALVTIGGLVLAWMPDR